MKAFDRSVVKKSARMFGDATPLVPARALQHQTVVADDHEEDDAEIEIDNLWRTEARESHLKQSPINIGHQRLWAALEAIRDGFAVFDHEDRLVAANRSYLAIFDGLEMVKPGIHRSELFALLGEEGIVDTKGLLASEWKQAM